MDELSSTIHDILNDPAQMERLAGMAKAILGGGESEANIGASEKKPGGKPRDGKVVLVEALSPYLRDGRRNKLQRALRIVQAMRVAGVVLGDGGDI